MHHCAMLTGRCHVPTDVDTVVIGYETTVQRVAAWGCERTNTHCKYLMSGRAKGLDYCPAQKTRGSDY